MAIVSVFGGSTPEPGSPDYQEAYALGRHLAGAGHAVMNGGYGGTMEAVSRGAHEAGGRVTGVTVGLFEDRYGIQPNPYVGEVVRYDTLHERLHHLIARCDAAVALRGGVGTLTEVALTWSLVQVREIALKPLVLVGAGWEAILSTYRAESYVKTQDMALIQTVGTAADVVPALAAWFETPPDIPPRLSKG